MHELKQLSVQSDFWTLTLKYPSSLPVKCCATFTQLHRPIFWLFWSPCDQAVTIETITDPSALKKPMLYVPVNINPHLLIWEFISLVIITNPTWSNRASRLLWLPASWNVYLYVLLTDALISQPCPKMPEGQRWLDSIVTCNWLAIIIDASAIRHVICKNPTGPGRLFLCYL